MGTHTDMYVQDSYVALLRVLRRIWVAVQETVARSRRSQEDPRTGVHVRGIIQPSGTEIDAGVRWLLYNEQKTQETSRRDIHKKT